MITMQQKDQVIEDAVAMWADRHRDYARHPKRVKRIVSYQMAMLLVAFPDSRSPEWYFMALGDECRTEEFLTLWKYEAWRRIHG